MTCVRSSKILADSRFSHATSCPLMAKSRATGNKEEKRRAKAHIEFYPHLWAHPHYFQWLICTVQSLMDLLRHRWRRRRRAVEPKLIFFKEKSKKKEEIDLIISTGQIDRITKRLAIERFSSINGTSSKGPAVGTTHAARVKHLPHNRLNQLKSLLPIIVSQGFSNRLSPARDTQTESLHTGPATVLGGVRFRYPKQHLEATNPHGTSFCPFGHRQQCHVVIVGTVDDDNHPVEKETDTQKKEKERIVELANEWIGKIREPLLCMWHWSTERFKDG